MTTDCEHDRRILALCRAAMDKSPATWRSYIKDELGATEEEWTEVERLLNGHERAGRFLHSTDFGLLSERDSSFIQSEPVERRAGAFRLLRPIATGGTSRVWLGERADERFKQRVAIKLMPWGLFSDAERARFEKERQTLALLEHANITRLIDGGTTEGGVPFLVMEYVEGTRIDRHCDDGRLSVRQRLELFREVCAAVHFAHRNLIVHRDLKPSNVLVTDQGTLKLLDFGVSKLVDAASEGGDATMTVHRRLTPQYASPEQVRGGTITTASDIYSLGVMLFELLTGLNPHDVVGGARIDRQQRPGDAESVAPSGAVRRLRSMDEPMSPDKRIDIQRLSSSRGETPESLVRRLRGDLDNIVVKALQVDANRRYASVIELSEDLRRYLRGEPVIARRDTIRYRLAKWVTRNAVTVAISAIMLVGLLVTAGVAMIGWRKAADAERQARASYADAVNARQLAERSEEETRRQAAIAEAVNRFLNDDVLSSADPYLDSHPSITMAEVLDLASSRIAGRFENQPLVEAAVRATLGRAFLNLGRHAQAEQHLQRALAIRERHLEPTHKDRLDSMNELAAVYEQQGHGDKAARMFEEVLSLGRDSLPPGHEIVIVAMSSLGDIYREQGHFQQAEDILQEALELRRADPADASGDLVRSSALLSLSILYEKIGSLDKAESVVRKCIEARERALGRKHLRTLHAKLQLSSIMHDAGRLDEAKRLTQQIVESGRQVLGDKHPFVIEGLNRLALLHLERGQFAQAEPLFRQVIDSFTATLGPEHPSTLRAMSSLAVLYAEWGRYEMAEPLHRQAYEIRRRTLGPEHPETLESQSSYGVLLAAMGQHAKAIELYNDALEKARRILGDNNELTLRLTNNLAQAHSTLGRHERALALYRRAADGYEAIFGPNHRQTLTAKANLAATLADMNRVDEASKIFERVLQTQQRVLGHEHPDTLNTMNALANAYAELKQGDKAADLLQQTLDIRRRVLGPTHPDTLVSMNNLARHLIDFDKNEQAASLYSELIGPARDAFPADHWILGAFLSNQGRCLVKLKQFDKAESVLLESHRILRAAIGADHERTKRTAQLLVDLYEQTNQPEKADQYRR